MSKVYVLPSVLRANLEKKEDNPPIVCKTGDAEEFAHSALIVDDAGRTVAKVIYEAKGGGVAQVWIEVERRRVRLL